MNDRPTGIPSIDVRTAEQRTEADGALIVDVRERDEFVAMRAPGVALVPLSGFAESWSSIPKDRPILVMCASGSRSLVATDLLRRNGYDAVNVTGGIKAWQAEGLPVTGGPPAPDEGRLPTG